MNITLLKYISYLKSVTANLHMLYNTLHCGWLYNLTIRNLFPRIFLYFTFPFVNFVNFIPIFLMNVRSLILFCFVRRFNFFKTFHILCCCKGLSPKILVKLINCYTNKSCDFVGTSNLFVNKPILMQSVIFIDKFLLLRRTTSWENLLDWRKFY